MSHSRRPQTLGTVLFVVITAVLVLAPGTWAQSKYKTLKTFTQRGPGQMNGYSPSDSLIVDQAGNLYGTTVYGGTNNCSPGIPGCGVVFKLTPNAGGTWTESVLYRFAGGNDGANPYAGLIFDAAGNLYGTTWSGGANSANGFGGTVFKLTPKGDGTWSESVLYSFCSLTNCADGALPYGGVILDQKGNLYGTTVIGGSSSLVCNGGNKNCGVVFKLTPNAGGGWTESVLYNFTGGNDGGSPFGSLIFDQSGNLYGTAEESSAGSCRFGCGVVFQLTPQVGGNWTESVLHGFTGGSDGGVPVGELIFDAKGNLYGATTSGGHIGRFCSVGCGLAFELTPNGGSWTETVLHQFRGIDGGFPAAGLTFDAAGNLWGTTEVDGPRIEGVVFKLTPNSSGGWRETVVHAFQNHPGGSPRAGIVFDGAGNLYGTTYGDSTTFGSVFEIAP
jgi:hypothetical protein